MGETGVGVEREFHDGGWLGRGGRVAGVRGFWRVGRWLGGAGRRRRQGALGIGWITERIGWVRMEFGNIGINIMLCNRSDGLWNPS